MGTPKRIRRKYDTPIHPWIKSRIDDEKRLAKTYGTKNKKEIWRMETVLKKFKSQAKSLIAATGDQAALEKEHLLRRVKDFGLVGTDVNFDNILGMSIDNVMERRLQTLVFKKGFARSIKQARQFIAHEHILVGGRTITSPSYLVTVAEESQIEFSPSSSLYSEEHPERASPEDKENMKAKAPKMEETEEKKGDADEQSAGTQDEGSEGNSQPSEGTGAQNTDTANDNEDTENTGENK